MYSLLSTALFSLGVAAGPLSTSHAAVQNSARTLTLAPVFLPHAEVAQNAINNSYIVVLKQGAVLDDHVMSAQTVHAASPLENVQGGGIRHVYDSHIKGYAGLFSQQALEQLRALPEVDYIEQDQRVYALDVSPPLTLTRLSYLSASSRHRRARPGVSRASPTGRSSP